MPNERNHCDSSDADKLHTIFLVYNGLMYHVANSILQNHHDAEDAVQQSFVNLAESSEKIDKVISPRTKGLVITIVKNVSLNMLDKNSRFESLEYDDSLYSVPFAEEESGLADCILKLPEKYQQVIYLKFSFGFENNEIARIMNTTETNVRKLIERAKKKLAKLQQEGEATII